MLIRSCSAGDGHGVMKNDPSEALVRAKAGDGSGVMKNDLSKTLVRAKAGDAEALRVLLNRCGPRARLVIRGRIGPQWQSILSEDDVMQVAYLEAFLHLHQLDADTEAGFVQWLGRIARNALRDAIKGLSCSKRPPPAGQATSPPGDESYDLLLDELAQTSTTASRHAAVGEAIQALKKALRELPPEYARVVQLFDLEGRSATDVAATIERSEGAVYMLRARAHARLRTVLGSASRFFSRVP